MRYGLPNLYDAAGVRLLRRSQKGAIDGSTPHELCKADKGRLILPGILIASLSNGPIPLPARTCTTANSPDFTFDLKSRYDLPSGGYTIRFHYRRTAPPYKNSSRKILPQGVSRCCAVVESTFPEAMECKWTRGSSQRHKARVSGVFYLLALLSAVFVEAFVRGSLLYAARSLRLSSAIVTLLLYPILMPVKSGSVQVTLVSPNEQQGSRRVDLDRVLLAVDGKNLLHGVALKGCVRACHSRFAQNVAGASRTDRVRAIVMHNAVAIRSSQRGMETSPTVG